MKYIFSVSVFVSSKDHSSFLFAKKTEPPFEQYFLPPSGPVKEDEYPIIAAKRIVKETTGFDISISDFRGGVGNVLDAGTVRLPNPIHIQVEHVDKNKKLTNIIYLAEPTEQNEKIENKFNKNVSWLSINEIKTGKIPKNVKDMALFLFKFKED